MAGAQVSDSVPSDYQFDLGNLLVFHPRDVEIASSSSQEEWEHECLARGTLLVQALAAKLWAIPSTDDKSGRLACLPDQTTPLPREKPLPKPRPPTKWELFAQRKGIQKRKRSKLEFDDNSQEWRRRHGYKRVADENDVAVIEAKATDDPAEDPFSRKRSEKKERVTKNEKNRLQNLKQAAKAGGKGALPSTLQLAATQVPITGTKEPVKRMSKDQFGNVATLAATATASVGKFDKKLPGEKVAKNAGKHRKFLPVAPGRGPGNQEKRQMQDVLSKVMCRHETSILDVDKAMGAHKVEEEGKRAKEHQDNGGKKRKRPADGRAGKGPVGGKRGGGAGKAEYGASSGKGKGGGKAKFGHNSSSSGKGGKGKKQKRVKR